MPYHAGQRHVRAGDCVHGPDHIALDAGNFHQPGHGVTHKALQVGQRHGKGFGALFGGAAAQLHQGGGCHGAGSADLGLAAALGAGQRGTRGHNLPKPGGDIQRAADGFLVIAAAAPQGQQHRGQNAAAARRGRGDNSFHAGVAFGGFQGFGHHLGQIAASQQLAAGFGFGHFGSIAARKAAGGTIRATVVIAGLHHHLPQVVHFGQGLGAGQPAFQQVALQNNVPQGLVVLAADVQHCFNGRICHNHAPSFVSVCCARFRPVTFTMPCMPRSSAIKASGRGWSHSSTITA